MGESQVGVGVGASVYTFIRMEGLASPSSPPAGFPSNFKWEWLNGLGIFSQVFVYFLP